MTSKQRLLAAMIDGVESEFPVVIPYLGIFLRDHWSEVTDLPWWALADGDIERSLDVARDLQEKLAIDWIPAHASSNREWRENHEVKTSGAHIYIVDKRTGAEREIFKPPIGGEQNLVREAKVKSKEDADRLLVETPKADDLIERGALDYAQAVVKEFGAEKFTFASIAGPFWSTHGYFGFYKMMTNIMESPRLVEHLLERITENSLEYLRAYSKVGIDGVWLEDCYTSADLISLEHFRRFVKPYAKRQIDVINSTGMKSIYYFCGDVSDRLEDIIEMGPTCVSFEESKKGFEIEIEDIDRIVDGRACIFGNIDALGILQNASSEDVRKEVERQIAIGRRHGKFVASLGSPVTPKTPTAKVRQFVDIARETAR